MSKSESMMLEISAEGLACRLPPGWQVEPIQGDGTTDGSLRITSSEGRSRTIPVEIKRRIDPRTARLLPLEPSSIVVAPYLSKSVRSVLEERGASYVDQTGNVRVVVDTPGLFVLASGAETNPWPDQRRMSLRGVKAARVVLALVAARPPLGVRALAHLAGTDPGYVSRLMRMLDGEAIVERSARGQVEDVEWRKLLVRWAQDAPLASRTEPTMWLAARGLGNVEKRLVGAPFRYLLTGSAAAARVAPVAPTRLLSLYVDDAAAAAETLGLRRAEVGANVVLLQPEDDAIYDRATDSRGLAQAPLPLVAADLLTGSGRSPAEAEALLDWMENNEGVWRG